MSKPIEVNESQQMSLDDDENDPNSNMISITHGNNDYKLTKQQCSISKFLKNALADNDDTSIEITVDKDKTLIGIKHCMSYLTMCNGVEASYPEFPLKADKLEDIIHDKKVVKFLQDITKDCKQKNKHLDLYETVHAAHYLDIYSLLRLSCAAVALLIKGEPMDYVSDILDGKREKTLYGKEYHDSVKKKGEDDDNNSESSDLSDVSDISDSSDESEEEEDEEMPEEEEN